MRDDSQIGSCYRVMVVGVGGGGGKAVNQMVRRMKNAPNAAAINTDSQALADSLTSTRLQIGITVTKGLGTGGDPELGKMAAENDVDMIRNLFVDSDLVCVVVGLGGGTGTGSAPTIVKCAREAGAMTLCFATLPFKFEGQQRRAVAENGLEELQRVSDAVIVISNDRLFELVGSETGVAEAFQKADDVVGAGICAICRLVTKPGFINLDFADLQKVVHHSGGISTFGYAEWGGKRKAKNAVKALLEGPMLEKGQVVSNAGSLLVSIVGGQDLTLKEVDDIMSTIGTYARKDAHVFMGTVIDDDASNKTSVAIVASEEWAVEYDPLEHVAAQKESGERPHHGIKAKKTIKREKKRKGAVQTSFHLEEPVAKGRFFKGVEPTILDGQDLDIPTYIRRRIQIEK